MFPRNTSKEDLIRASKSFDLAEQAQVDWSKALQHPVNEIMSAAGGPKGYLLIACP